MRGLESAYPSARRGRSDSVGLTHRTQAPSAMPPSRFFAPPADAFATEIAVLSAGCATRDDRSFPGLRWIASEELPDAPLWVTLEGAALGAEGDVGGLARHLFDGLRGDVGVPAPAERAIVVGSVALANRLAAPLAAHGFTREERSFLGFDAARLAEGARLALEPLVGDDAWRDGGEVERALMTEALAPAPITDALLERTLAFKRGQQRHSPPIRRFVGRDPAGAPIAMVGYAPFGPCALGFAPAGVLVRLRDVAVVPAARRRGVATALLRAAAAWAIDECDATQVLLCAATSGPGAALYRKLGAREVGACVAFRGRPGLGTAG